MVFEVEGPGQGCGLRLLACEQKVCFPQATTEGGILPISFRGLLLNLYYSLSQKSCAGPVLTILGAEYPSPKKVRECSFMVGLYLKP